MVFPFNKPSESPKKSSRGQFLRNSVLTATGIALLPSFFSSCKKYVFEPGTGPVKGWGGVPTQATLQNAAANLNTLGEWIYDIYGYAIQYEMVVFDLLKTTRVDNPNWSKFIGNIFIDIGIGVTGAVAKADADGPAMPAFACLNDFLKDWNAGNETPPVLAGVVDAYLVGQSAIQTEIGKKLDFLVDPANNYSNLLTHWKDVIEFNGKSYTLSDLANSTFPDWGNEEYNQLLANGLTHFKKSLWNLFIMKCCTYHENVHQGIRTPTTPAAQFYSYAQNTFYPQNKGVYVRGGTSSDHGDGTVTWDLIYYNLGINGAAIPDEAANELFIDDTPGHVINPDGLWNRSYVFQQFSITKPVFNGRELAGYPNNGNNFNTNDAPDFTGGLFPRLTQ